MSSNHQITDRVEFRWRQHEEEFARLLDESARNAGCSPAEHARELLKHALTAAEQFEHHIFSIQNDVAQLLHQLQQLADLKKSIRDIHDNIFQFRDELATYTTKLLSDAGRMPSTDARKWMKTILDSLNSNNGEP